MPLDGLSAAPAVAATKKAKHNVTSRGSIRGTSDQIITTAFRRGLGRRGEPGPLWRVEIRQPAADAKLTIFHTRGADRSARAYQKALPMLRANQPLAGVPGVPEVTREYASMYQSLPG